MAPSNPLIPYLTRLKWRLRLRDGWQLAQRTLWWAMLLSVLVLVVGRLWPIEQLWIWALIPTAVWLVGVIGYTLFRPQPVLRVARRVDAELHLKERLSTSLVIDGVGGKQIPEALKASFQPELVDQLHADALHTMRGIDAVRDFPLRAERRALLFSTVALAAALALLFLPNPMDGVIRERQEVVRETQRQAEQIDRLRDQVKNAQEMSPEERDALLKRLAELSRQLHANTGNREEALANLSNLEESLRQKLDPKAGQRQAMLEAMAAQLQALSQNEKNPSGDLAAAAEAIQQLAEQMKSMSEEERQALAQQMAQMAARAAQAGDSQLAQTLAAMSQAAQSGDLQAASQAAQQAAQAMQQTQGELADQKAFSQTLNQLQNSRQAVANAGQQGQQRAQGQNAQGQNQGQSGQNGQGQNGQGQNGQGQQSGQGQGNQGQQPGQGQAGGGGGTTANTLPGGKRTGQAGDPQGQANPGGVGQLDSQVYVPREKRPQGDGELFIPGQDTDQGNTQTNSQRDPTTGSSNPALVPYQAVYQSYLDSAAQAMDQSYIPPGLKDYVKEYFSQLEP